MISSVPDRRELALFVPALYPIVEFRRLSMYNPVQIG